jgi:hypothetical protein
VQFFVEFDNETSLERKIPAGPEVHIEVGAAECSIEIDDPFANFG